MNNENLTFNLHIRYFMFVGSFIQYTHKSRFLYEVVWLIIIFDSDLLKRLFTDELYQKSMTDRPLDYLVENILHNQNKHTSSDKIKMGTLGEATGHVIARWYFASDRWFRGYRPFQIRQFGTRSRSSALFMWLSQFTRYWLYSFEIKGWNANRNDATVTASCSLVGVKTRRLRHRIPTMSVQ